MDIIEFASHLFLFSGMDKETLSGIFAKAETDIGSFSRSDIIYSPSEYEKKIGFVISGKCEIRRTKSEGGTVVLNILSRYDSFGALAVFSECGEYPTEVYAAKNSEIMFISKDTVFSLINAYPAVAMNVIRFLSDRITFLNKKIATFSGTKVEDRLASYLVSEYEKHGSSFTFNCKKSSEAINAGRASVYRALETLCNEGIILFANKKINILCPDGLKEISK